MDRESRELIKTAFAESIRERTGVEYEMEFYFARPERKWRSDIAFPSVRVAIEIDGGTWSYGRHNRASSVLSDMEKGNGYAQRGWLVWHLPWEWIEGGRRDRSAQLIADIASAIEGRKGDD